MASEMVSFLADDFLFEACDFPTCGFEDLQLQDQAGDNFEEQASPSSERAGPIQWPSSTQPCNSIESSSEIGNVPVPEVNDHEMTSYNLVQNQQFLEEIASLSLSEFDLPKGFRGRQQPKQIIFTLFKPKRYKF